MRKWPAWAAVCLLLLTACSSSEEKKASGVTLGINSQSSSQVSIGRSLCDLLGTSFSCKVSSDNGSAQALEHLQNGQSTLGMVRGDALHRAWNGQTPFQGKLNRLRVLFALQEEAVTLVAREKDALSFFQKNRGKRLNAGAEGSDNARLVTELSDACPEVLGDVSLGRLGPTELVHAMQSRAVDGFFDVLSHPDFALSRSMLAAPLEIVPIGGACVDTLIRKQPFFEAVAVPGKIYQGEEQDVPTVGVRHWVVAHAEMSEEMVYAVVRKVFNNIEKFRQSNPLLYHLSPRKMARSVLVPYHAGALKYYQEKGWFKRAK